MTKDGIYQQGDKYTAPDGTKLKAVLSELDGGCCPTCYSINDGKECYFLHKGGCPKCEGNIFNGWNYGPRVVFVPDDEPVKPVNCGKYAIQAEASWKAGDYVVAALPVEEKDAKAIYTCGYIDGCTELKEKFREAMKNWCKSMSVIDAEDINEICDSL